MYAGRVKWVFLVLFKLAVLHFSVVCKQKERIWLQKVILERFLLTLLGWYEIPGSSSSLATAWAHLDFTTFTTGLPNTPSILCSPSRVLFFSRVHYKRNRKPIKFWLCEDSLRFHSLDLFLRRMHVETKGFHIFYARHHNDGVIVT